MTTCDEMWNSATIYGSPSEIDRFKRSYIRPSTPDENDEDGFHLDLDGLEDSLNQTWNFRDWPQQDPWAYKFAFDTHTRFPFDAFEHLATLFPALAFDCECIADDDSSMGFGWFNPPAGGEDFCDRYNVPRGYWTRGRSKRAPKADQRHRGLIASLQQTLREAHGDTL